MARLKKESKPIKVEERVEKLLRHPHLPDSWWHQKLKISHRHHTAKVLPRHHTSYGLILLMLLLTGWLIVIAGSSALAGPPQTQQGSVNVSGTVAGAPPSDPAVITRPSNGQSFTATPITVGGTCPANTLVEIFRNDIFAGSAQCINQAFSLEVELIEGQNTLIAKVSDNSNQYGPDSGTVTVTYQATQGSGSSGGGSTGSTAGSSSGVSGLAPALLVSAESAYQGEVAGNELVIGVILTGGKPPYALEAEWGDGKRDIFPQAEAGTLKLRHKYEVGGVYSLIFTATDKLGAKSRLQTVVIIAGQKVPISFGNQSLINYLPQPFYVIWPLYILMICMVAMFWLGERYEFYKISRHRARQ